MQAADKFITDIEKTVEIFKNRLMKISKGSQQEILLLVSELDFYDELIKAGYLKSLKNFLDEYEETVDSLLAQAKGLGLKGFSQIRLGQLEAMTQLDAEWLLGSAEAYGAQLKSSMVKGITQGSSIIQIKDSMLQTFEKFPLTTNQLTVAVNQSFTNYRNVSLKNIFPADQKYILTHPADGKTRVICQYAIAQMANSPKGLTMAEIDGGALGGEYSFMNLGGFNCRGEWDILETKENES